MPFSVDASRLFGTSDLYRLLNLDGTPSNRKGLTQECIKKAFFKLSLKYHPDRCENESLKEEHTAKFQILNRAYSILSDTEKRAVYDETGIYDDDTDVLTDNVNWEMVWRSVFRRVTKEEIEEFIKNYKNSEEEKNDLKEAYLKHKGNMGKVVEEMIGASYEDEDRFRNVINELIEAGELKSFRRFAAEPLNKRLKRRQEAEKEAKEAEIALREIEEKEGSKDLVSLIRQRRKQTDFNSFCDSLADKYGKRRKK